MECASGQHQPARVSPWSMASPWTPHSGRSNAASNQSAALRWLAAGCTTEAWVPLGHSAHGGLAPIPYSRAPAMNEHLYTCMGSSAPSQDQVGESKFEDDDSMSYRRYRGRVKSLKSDSFGFIECAELFPRFGRDVFVQPSQLKHCEVGDEVTFCIFLNSHGQPQAKKIKEFVLGVGVEAGASQEDTVSDRQADQVFEGAVCIICQEVLHRATSVRPCLHSFCSSCLSGWVGRGFAASPSCPICRSVIKGVSRNHTLDGLINGLLKAHPNRKRAAQELQDLDADDLLDHVGYDLDAIRGGSSSISSAWTPRHHMRLATQAFNGSSLRDMQLRVIQEMREEMRDVLDPDDFLNLDSDITNESDDENPWANLT